MVRMFSHVYGVRTHCAQYDARQHRRKHQDECALRDESGRTFLLLMTDGDDAPPRGGDFHLDIASEK
jgi:hypothetical protein